MGGAAGLREIDGLEARQDLGQRLQMALGFLQCAEQRIAIRIAARQRGAHRVIQRVGGGAQMMAMVLRGGGHAQRGQGGARTRRARHAPPRPAHDLPACDGAMPGG
ncbi:MAG: hypothetical protein WDM84_03675 [Bauldia sp.]